MSANEKTKIVLGTKEMLKDVENRAENLANDLADFKGLVSSYNRLVEHHTAHEIRNFISLATKLSNDYTESMWSIFDDVEKINILQSKENKLDEKRIYRLCLALLNDGNIEKAKEELKKVLIK